MFHSLIFIVICLISFINQIIDIDEDISSIDNKEQEREGLKYSEYEIGKSDPVLQSCYKIYTSIKNNFVIGLDDLFVTNTLEDSKKSFDNLYVNFSLSDHPLYSNATKEGSKKDDDKPIKNYSDISKEKNRSFQSQINSSRSGYFSYREDGK